MVRLAVANRTETFERLRSPLAERGVTLEYVSLSRTSTPVADPPFDPGSFDAGFVFPGRLMEGGVLDALLDVPWVNDREAVLRSRNKAGALARLDRAGVPVPDSVLVSNPADGKALDEAFARFEPPVVVKPNSTTRGTGVAKVHDLDSFHGLADYLDLVHDYRATADKSFLVQEWLPDATDYRVMVVDGAVVGAVERRLPADERDGRWKHNVHRGANAEGVDLPADLRRLALDAAAAMDVPFLGVDLLVTADRAVVLETNARPTVDDATKYEQDFHDRLATLIGETARR